MNKILGKFVAIVLCLLGFFTMTGVFAQNKNSPGLTKDELDSLQSMDETIKKLEMLQKQTELITKKRFYDCNIAVGNVSFCKCLNERLPMVLSFPAYVDLILIPKDKLSYNSLGAEERKLVDKTYEAREACVQQHKN